MAIIKFHIRCCPWCLLGWPRVWGFVADQSRACQWMFVAWFRLERRDDRVPLTSTSHNWTLWPSGQGVSLLRICSKERVSSNLTGVENKAH